MWTPRGKKGWDELGDWDWHIYTIDTMYKILNYWAHTVLYRELYSVLCGDLNGKEIWERGNICEHTADSFCIQEKLTQRCKAAKESRSRSVVSDSMDYTVHAILQARILEWVVVSFSRGSSQPRDRTQVSCIAGWFFTSWATREAREYWSG